MLRLLAGVFLFPLLASVCSNALLPTHTLEFVVITENLPDEASVHITGNIDALGNWDVNGVELEKRNNGSWSTRVPVKHGTELEYKVSLGSWDTEALDEEGRAPANSYLHVIRDTTITLNIPAWKPGFAKSDFDEQPHPQYSIIFTVDSDSVPPGATVYISGNHEKLGNWQAGIVELDVQHDGSWSKTIAFRDGTYLEYKFTLGSWSREALTANGDIPDNSRLTVREDETVHVRVPAWSDWAQ